MGVPTTVLSVMKLICGLTRREWRHWLQKMLVSLKAFSFSVFDI